jgi:uncharacterized protein Usg
MGKRNIKGKQGPGAKFKLSHSLNWFVENYGLPLTTVKRRRTLLDRPHMLQRALLNGSGRTPDLTKFIAFWDSAKRSKDGKSVKKAGIVFPLV